MQKQTKNHTGILVHRRGYRVDKAHGVIRVTGDCTGTNSYMNNPRLRYSRVAREDLNVGLVNAAAVGEPGELSTILDAKADANYNSGGGHTALHFACLNGNGACVDLLLGGGANVHSCTKDGITGLVWASRIGDLSILCSMINAGADVNHADRNGTTGLHSACRGGHVDCLRRLIESGANVCSHRNDGETGFTLAIANGHHQAFHAVLAELTAPKNSREQTNSILEEALAGALELKSFHCVAEQAAMALLGVGVCIAGDGATHLTDRASDRLAATTQRLCATLLFANAWHDKVHETLAFRVHVDDRVGLGVNGLYHEALERVLEYLGLCIEKEHMFDPHNGTAVVWHAIRKVGRNVGHWDAWRMGDD